MDDGKQNKDVEGDLEGEPVSSSINDGDVFQSLWIRHNPIFSCLFDRKFMESKLRLVLYLGTIFWFIFLFAKTI
jgi:hypothetical protein